MSRRPILMIPGPVELPPAVQSAGAEPPVSHMDERFVTSFGDALRLMRQVWGAPSGQPFVVSGSGTLAMEMAAANLVEPEDRVLVTSSGVFGERFAQIFERHGARVEVVRAPLGEAVDPEAVRSALDRGRFKAMTITHVDTSTAVRTDPSPLAALAKERGVLTILDGVCSVGGEALHQAEWEIDVALTASQKALAAPPGLALVVASPDAMETWRRRKRPVRSYYADWGNWLPIMEGYEGGRPSYFGTPPVTLVRALAAALSLAAEEGMVQRVARHQRLGKAFRKGLGALGVVGVPASDGCAASTLSCAHVPDGVAVARLVAETATAGALIAGGLHPEIRSRSFRVGHMGAVDATMLLATVDALEQGLARCGHGFERGVGHAAAREVLES